MMISLSSRVGRRAGDWAFLGPILAAALLIRILAGLWVDAWEGPDWGSYVGSARDLLGGRGLTSAYHPPLYSVFLSGVFGVFGESLGAVRTLQALLGVFVAWALPAWLARSAFCFPASWCSGRWGGAAALRPNGFSRPRLIAAYVALVLATTIVIAPWTAYNARRFRAFVPVTTSSGHVLLGGNNPHTKGMWDEPHSYREYAYIEKIEDYAERRKAYRREVLSFLRKTPWPDLLRLYAWKLWLFWDNFDDRFNWMYAALLPFAAVGFWLTRRYPRAWLIHLGVANFLVFSSVFYANSRMRSPAEPLLIVLAGVAIDRLFADREDRWNSLLRPVPVLAAHVALYAALYFSWTWITTRNKLVVAAWLISTVWIFWAVRRRGRQVTKGVTL